MKILLVSPTPATCWNGNRMTAQRYARILRGLGHEITVRSGFEAGRWDVFVTLHAQKSSDSIHRSKQAYPDLPIILVLTGTDLYRDIKRNDRALQSLELASRIIVLQARGIDEVPVHLRSKTRVIYQSADGMSGLSAEPPSTYFRVCVVSNLRAEKDPLRAAFAARRLSAASRVKVVHAGTALNRHLERQAVRETSLNPRYRWVGPLPPWKTRRLIAESHVVAVTSKIEGGSNVLSESLAVGVPVAASEIPGLIGTLGQHYPAYFAPGDTKELARLLERLERDGSFYSVVGRSCKSLAYLTSPAREIESWRDLLVRLL